MGVPVEHGLLNLRREQSEIWVKHIVRREDNAYAKTPTIFNDM